MVADYDVAIVGGGISGVYTGWRLLTADLSQNSLLRQWAQARGRLKTGLFEGSKRIGGRLLSARAPGMDNTVCEIGGMRYVSSQTLVRSLIENKLQLAHHQQVVDRQENLVYLRGRRVRMGETSDPSKLPYDLSWLESEQIRGNNNGNFGRPAPNDPSSLIGWAMTRIFPQLDTLHGAELQAFLQSAELDGIPLYQHGFWNILARAMSSEAYDLSRLLVGYDCLGENMNAVDLTKCYFDFTPDVTYNLIDQGFETVPWTLEAGFRAAGGEVIQETWLQSFEQAALADGTTGVRLHFNDGRTPVTARALVLAMPQHSIRKLAPTGPVLDPSKAPRVQSMLGAVQPIGLYKIFVGYSHPWWEQTGATQGRSFTDLPVRQCYYWAKNQPPSSDPNTTNALVMVYDDAANVDFWGGLSRLKKAASAHLGDHGEPAGTPFARRAAAQGGAASSHPFESRLRENWRDHQATALLVAETHRQLMAMHGVPVAPDPLEAAYMDWMDEPFGGAVHLWNRGYKSWTLVEDITQPVADFPCYICGEAYSTNQTWSEGALQTAEIVLQKRLGLSAPDWVTSTPKTAVAHG